jgi:hypothetical protein
LHAFAFLSNHWHAMLSTLDGAQLADFMGFVNGNLAKELGSVHGWKGKLWGRRTRPIPILDEDAMIARLRYILAQGVKEGLVERPEQWPGATSTPWLLGDKLVGTWICRDEETRALRRSSNPDPSRYTYEYEVRMSPLPCWASLSRQEIAARTRALIDDVVTEARATRGAVLGVEAVLRQDPHAMPREPKRGPAPICHAASHSVRVAFAAAYRAFIAAFRAAADIVRGIRSTRTATFPPGSFPCAAIHIQPPPTFVPPWLPGMGPPPSSFDEFAVAT